MTVLTVNRDNLQPESGMEPNPGWYVDIAGDLVEIFNVMVDGNLVPHWRWMHLTSSVAYPVADYTPLEEHFVALRPVSKVEITPS